jgi:hypothetical protein
MRARGSLPRRSVAALAFATAVVAASVGKCDLPQPKFPTLGSAPDPATRTGAVTLVAAVAPPDRHDPAGIDRIPSEQPARPASR